MDRRRVFISIVLLVICGGALFAAFFLHPSSAVAPGGGEAIALISIEGVLVDSPAQVSLLGTVAGSQEIIRQLRLAREDRAVKAVLLRLNSPGGSAAASQEIAAAVKETQKAGKIVVASLGDTAASGAYWVAAATDYIVANPATLTGSIGVIIEVQNLSELYRKLGIEVEVIKSGPHKDMGSSSRELTPQEKEIFQGMVEDIYQQFVEVVAEGRKLPREKVEALADGRVFTGRQAEELGLVDELGSYEDALARTATLAGISGKPVVRTYARRGFWEVLTGGVSPFLQSLLSPFLLLMPSLWST